MSEAKTRLAAQENETKKAESKFQLSVSEAEKLKTSFTAEKEAWANEKTALTQHAEKAEAALEEVTTELTGLKNRLSQMVSAIFGKSPCYLPKVSIYHHNISHNLTNCVNFTGPRSRNLSRDTVVKLKAVYTLVEQLYTRAQRTLATVSPVNQGPNLLSDV